MSNIQENLQNILSAVWGRDVRQAIHDAIHDCYEDGSAGSIDLIAREDIDDLETSKADVTALQTETDNRLAEVAIERGRIDAIRTYLTDFEVYVNVLIGQITATNNTAIKNNIDVSEHIPTGYELKSVQCIGTGNLDYHCYECDLEDDSTTQIKLKFHNSANTGGNVYPWVKLRCVKVLT